MDQSKRFAVSVVLTSTANGKCTIRNLMYDTEAPSALEAEHAVRVDAAQKHPDCVVHGTVALEMGATEPALDRN